MAIFIFTHSQDADSLYMPSKGVNKISATFSSTTLFMTVEQLLVEYINYILYIYLFG